MAKFTDPDYFLPVIEALEANKILDSGRTKPTLIRGICSRTTLKSEYVVKFKGDPEMYPGASCKELLASFIGMELEFNIPEPAIINISDEFAEVIKESRAPNAGIISRSLGFNFGTYYIEGYLEPMREQTFPEEMIREFSNLFALDIFLGNPDRRVKRPNFLTNGKKILIYDHELAFSFNEMLIKNPSPWLIPDADMAWISENYCFNLLKGRNLDFSIFAARLSRLGEGFWTKASENIPLEWNEGRIEQIRSYLDRIVENRDQFATELNRILL